MRLTKGNLNKNDKKKNNKNKSSIFEEKQNGKNKMENPYLQEKIRKYNKNLLKEKYKGQNLKALHDSRQFKNNANIYRNKKKIQNKNQNLPIKIDSDRNNDYENNKSNALNENNNINIGNNINIITNNHTHENNNNSKNNNNKEIQIQNNFINTSEILTDFNLSKKQGNDIYNTNKYNNLITRENNINRKKVEAGNDNRRFRRKNISMEHRYKRLGKDIANKDGDLMTDEDNLNIMRNHIYLNLQSPKLNFNDYTDYNIFNENNLLNKSNNHYFYNKDFYDLEDRIGNTFYNNFYKLKNMKKTFNNNANRNKYNTLIVNNDIYKKNNLTNDDPNKTNYCFYIHKTPENNHKNRNIITNMDYSDDNDEEVYTNYMLDNKRILKNKGLYHSMIEDNDLPLSPYLNYADTNINFMENNKNNPKENKTIRRSKNKIKIVKKNNNSSIQEYNLSLGEDDDNDYQNEFNLSNNRKDIINEGKESNKNFNHFYNIQPITNSQFIIYSKISNQKMNLTSDNFFSRHKTINSKKKNNIQNKEGNINISKNNENLINYKNKMKTPEKPKISKKYKINPFINNDSSEKQNSIIINNNNKNEDNPKHRIMVKKRPKNDTFVPSGGMKKRNSSYLSLNKNLSKMDNTFEICSIEKINYAPDENEKEKEPKIDEKNNNKFIFNNENEIIDYIFNKFEEERKKKSYFNRKLRFTGFVLSKKYKGKNLVDIRIEDNIDKINQQLKEEKVLISEREVEFKFLDNGKENSDKEKINNNDNNDDKIVNNELIEEYKKLKLENEKLNKKDIVKNDLIKKLDNDKMNFIEEIKRLKKEIDELNNKNKLIEEKTINNKKNNLEIENNILFVINSSCDQNKINKKNPEIINMISIKEKNNNEEKNKKEEKIIVIKDNIEDNIVNKTQIDEKENINQGNEKNKLISIKEEEKNKKEIDNNKEIINQNENRQKSNFNVNNLTNKEEII